MGNGLMSEEQQLIDRLVNNYKAEQIRVATRDIVEPTPAELQQAWLDDLEERVAEGDKRHKIMLGLYAANIIMMTVLGYLSIMAIILVSQKP